MKNGMAGDNKLNVLRKSAVLTAIVAAVCSLSLMLYAGRRNPSIILTGLFIIWVMSPFVVLLRASTVFKRWSSTAQRLLYIIMLLISFCSLVFYCGLLEPSGVKTAFKFLIVPFLSWCLIFICYLFIRKKIKS